MEADDTDSYIHVRQGGNRVAVPKSEVSERVLRLCAEGKADPSITIHARLLLSRLRDDPTDPYQVLSRVPTALAMQLPLGLQEYLPEDNKRRLRTSRYGNLCGITKYRSTVTFKVKDQTSGEERYGTAKEWEETLYALGADDRENRLKEIAEVEAEHQAIVNENLAKIAAIRAKPGYAELVARTAPGVYYGESGTTGGGAVSKERHEAIYSGQGFVAPLGQ